MDKSVPMQDYTVYSNQGTPDVYFDGKFVGKIADGSLTVSMPYKEEGYTVTLENYTVKDMELYVGDAYIPITVAVHEDSETDDAGDIVEWWFQVGDVTFENVVIEVYRRHYYNVTSGKIKKNLTLNYNTSVAKDHNETGYITSTSDVNFTFYWANDNWQKYLADAHVDADTEQTRLIKDKTYLSQLYDTPYDSTATYTASGEDYIAFTNDNYRIPFDSNIQKFRYKFKIR